ncbi:phosphate transport system permease protein [Deinobacterium chartae]|uniref:Phosphate transport system permease protein n=1 Tax=Deinobacterium chartae TaxID=521158 RepID=A0A841I0B8_9DEIO|nr:phosphate ABC transporter permease subunit PstC [Deinobacterium chartae]MBB6099231.1 phosphate transport system permease protein [Deinobacterium chartae]
MIKSARPAPSSRGDGIFKGIIIFIALCIVAIFGLSMYELYTSGKDAFSTFGFFGFIGSSIWDPVAQRFGAWTFIAGTALTSVLALVIAVPLALASAIFVTEYAPRWLSEPVSYLVELLAAIPSVIYGLWAIFVLVPIVRNLQLSVLLNPNLREIDLIQVTAPSGLGLLTAVLILAVMVIPYTASVARDVIRLVPQEQREAAYALGATKWEVIRTAILPYARAGIMGGVILSLGRALGETIAVTMVIGNTTQVPKSIFDSTATMASVIANQFGEASGLQLSSLIGLGFLLFLLSVVVNFTARIIIARLTPEGIKV